MTGSPRALAAVLVLALAGACSSGDDAAVVDEAPTTTRVFSGDEPDEPLSPLDPRAPAVEPEGFTTITARIIDADGEVCEVCVWLADDPVERAQGLMFVTDLGDAAGMVFRFAELRVGNFFMFNTPTPLSIAWFGEGGAFVGATDMEPCLPDDFGDPTPLPGTSEIDCPLYSPGTAYDLALEVFRGDLDDLGVGPGARLELVAGTEALRCPVSR